MICFWPVGRIEVSERALLLVRLLTLIWFSSDSGAAIISPSCALSEPEKGKPVGSRLASIREGSSGREIVGSDGCAPMPCGIRGACGRVPVAGDGSVAEVFCRVRFSKEVTSDLMVPIWTGSVTRGRSWR